MSLVVGVNIENAVVFGCDGFGLVERKDSKTVKKLYTCTKLKILRPWNIVLGYVGETEALLDIVSPIISCGEVKTPKQDTLDIDSRQCLTEEDFLSHLSREVRRLHHNTKTTHIVLVCGYCRQHGNPVQFFFDRDGERSAIKEFVCIGSGAEIASKIIRKKYAWDLSPEKACSLVINAIYAASLVPTVNSLPMIVVASATGIHDFTVTTKLEYSKFKRALRSTLLSKVRTIKD